MRGLLAHLPACPEWQAADTTIRLHNYPSPFAQSLERISALFGDFLKY